MDDRNDPLVDLVIPARNEQDNIPALLATLPDRDIRHVIVVDNGSTDRTAELATMHGATVICEPRRGYGAACLAGLAWIATLKQPPDIVAFLDADLADDPTDLPRLCRPIARGQADLVIASRRLLAQPGALTGPQRLGNAVACAMIRMLTGQRYTDLGPMRAARWSSLRSLDMSDQTWGWTVEMQFKAAARGMPVLEIATLYRPRRAGNSKISGTLTGSVRAGWKIMATIIRLSWQHRHRSRPERTGA